MIFRLPGPITYRGRVLHGVTRQPVANAIVIGWNSTARNNLALLSDDDWKRLEQAPSNPPLDHPAMKLLGKYYGVQGLVRTNEDGRFDVVRQPDQEFYGIMAFNRDSVPFKVHVVSLKPNAERQIEIDEFPTYSPPQKSWFVQSLTETDCRSGRIGFRPVTTSQNGSLDFKRFNQDPIASLNTVIG